MDANEYACKVTPAEKSLRLLVNAAEWLARHRDTMRLRRLQTVAADVRRLKLSTLNPLRSTLNLLLYSCSVSRSTRDAGHGAGG